MTRFHLLLTILVFVLVAATAGCPAHRGGERLDDEGGYDDEGDGSTDRRRKRRRRSRSRNPVLIQARRLPGAVVERGREAPPPEEIDELRQTLCPGNEDRERIFYQLVVGGHWHYYWLCSKRRAVRAATSRGNRLLLGWLDSIQRRAETAGGRCAAGSRNRLFTRTHKSGTVAHAYCDGRIVLRFADGGTTTRSFAFAPSTTVAPQTGRCPPCPTAPGCPLPRACPRCPPPTRCPLPRVCPRCPPPKVCPVCNCDAQHKKGQVVGFWKGAKKACDRICTLVYKRCRQIDPKTAMCYRMSEFCAENCFKKKKK